MRVRIFLAVFFIGVGSTLLVGYGVLGFYKNQSITSKISHMVGYTNQIANQMVLSGYLSANNRQPEISAELSLAAELSYRIFLVLDGNLRVILITYRQQE